MIDQEYKPVIGKNVIETLTLGMYEDSRIIYREYIQNAADQIDVAVEETKPPVLKTKSDGQILISIDPIQRSITIEDNATGIKSGEALQFLADVAKSTKDPNQRKGFRGIGRLGGLGYCKKLTFETSYRNEPFKSIVSLDADELRQIISNKTITLDASSVISAITSLDSDEEKPSAHYFKVKLEGVTDDTLLDEQAIRTYLSMVAPVPFATEFSFRDKIHKHFDTNNIVIDEYNVCNVVLNNEKIYKAYKDEVVDKAGKPIAKVLAVRFFKIRNWEKKTIAIGWYGVTDFLNKKIPLNNIERGFRIRKSNITIGNEHTLNRFFKEQRFNHHYIGEIHVIGPFFIPNARRDFFNDNRTVNSFTEGLTSQFKRLTKLSHTCSDLRSRLRDLEYFRRVEAEFDTREKVQFLNESEEEFFRTQLRNAKALAAAAVASILEIEKTGVDNNAVNVLFNHIIGKTNLRLSDDNSDARVRSHKDYVVHNLLTLNAEVREIVLEVFDVIEETIGIERAAPLKRAIIERLTEEMPNE